MNLPGVDDDNVQSSASSEKDCAVCLQKCHHPTQLPCGHVFCFLCVKGVAIQSRKCAMCRAAIPPDYLDHPILLEKLTLNKPAEENSPGAYQWYYEGRNGWWKYDERSNADLEIAWNSEATECALLLAGAVYNIDFQTMIQTRRNDPTRRRHVKRDASTLPAKGIAGIKIIVETKTEAEGTSPVSPQSAELIEENNQISTISESNSVTVNEAAPDPNENDISNIVENLNTLNLGASTAEQEDT